MDAYRPHPAADPDDLDARFEGVFRALYGGLCSQAYALLRDRARAEDAVQDVFASVWVRRTVLLSELTDPAETVERLTGYLRVAVRNRCRKLLARDFTARQYAGEVERDRPGVTAPEADEAMLGAERRGHVDRAIAALPPQQRVVLMLRRFDGMSTAEVAAQLGVSVKTVENHLGRALKRLASALRDAGMSEGRR